MAKFFDNKVFPKPPTAADPARYLLAGTSDFEPNLGVPPSNNYALTSDTSGNRSWSPMSGGPGPSLTLLTLEQPSTTLAPGESFLFNVNLGKLFIILSIAVQAISPDSGPITALVPPEESWIRMYTSIASRDNDTRIIPGPPFPSENSGYAIEVVTTSEEQLINFLPSPTIYAPNFYSFFNLVNQSDIPLGFNVIVTYLKLVENDAPAPA